MMALLSIGYHGRALALPPLHLQLPVSMASTGRSLRARGGTRCDAAPWTMVMARIGPRATTLCHGHGNHISQFL